MKDSKGLEYDGWVFKNSRGILLTWTYSRTRSLARSRFHRAAYEDLKLVKVLFLEVGE